MVVLSILLSQSCIKLKSRLNTKMMGYFNDGIMLIDKDTLAS